MPPARAFPDRPVAWQEHDDGDIARPPADTDLVDQDVTIVLRDSLAGEVDYHLTLEGRRPARDVNALDEVPCSTWFCARNHHRAMSPREVAIGPPATPPRPPFRILKGKARGAALGFEVVDAAGRKFLLKLDVAGHRGMASAAEVVGGRIFHAAGYNVPGSFALDVSPETDLTLDPAATFILYEVQRRPLTAEQLREQLATSARGPDGRIRAVAVSWLPGKIVGAFDMIGRRADDPNDRIPHEQRRSLRASRLLFAWLAVLDAGSLNTLDSYVEERRPALRPALLHRLRRGPGFVHDARERSPARAGAHHRGGTEPGGAGRAGPLSAAVPATSARAGGGSRPSSPRWVGSRPRTSIRTNTVRDGRSRPTAG